jgi:alkylated DNA repair dioxygenase AlkB
MQEKTYLNGDIILYPGFLYPEESAALFLELSKETPWRQDEIRIFGKWLKQPRMTCVFGDEGMTYTYSGLTQPTLSWTSSLHTLRNKIQSNSGEKFNLVLLNLYRDGNDSMGWHSDDEPELGNEPVIASVSLGEERKLKFRPKKNTQGDKFDVLLPNGSLLIMKGRSQHDWQHAISKSKKITSPRINLTFRLVKD